MTVLHVAGIGSRDLTEGQLDVCRRLGAHLVNCGHCLHSGNAKGADQGFAAGANQVRPDLVKLHLPWWKYERQAIHPQNYVISLEDLTPPVLGYYQELARQHHPRFPALTQGGRRLMTRNSGILVPRVEFKTGLPRIYPVDLCLAWPLEKRPGQLGGTGQGMRIAQALGIRLIDLRHQTEGDSYNLCEELTEKGKE